MPNITFEVEHPTARSWIQPDGASGDVGSAVSEGPSKIIYWEPSGDVLDLESNIDVRITAA